MGTELNRRSFLKGTMAFGAVAATGALAACSSNSAGSASAAAASSAAASAAASAGSASAAAPEVGAKYAQGPQMADVLKCPVAADAQWELVAHVENTGILEGMNWHDGTLWFIDVASSRIFKLDDNGEVVEVYNDPEKKAMPNGAKFIDDDTILLCDRAQGLCTYTISTGEYKVIQDSFEGKKFLGLNDLVLDGAGGAYFTDPGQSDYFNNEGAVYYVNYGDGSYSIEKIVSTAAYPNGITISPDGLFLYIAEFNTNSIICVPSKNYTDAKDTPYVFARLTGGHGPDGVLTDAAGNVYAAHLNAKEVAMVDNAGWPMPSIRLPEAASPLVSNLLIAEGYLYACDFGGKNIWKIPISAEPNPLA